MVHGQIRAWLADEIHWHVWLANALEKRRAIAERHSTEVECLNKNNINFFRFLPYRAMLYNLLFVTYDLHCTG